MGIENEDLNIDMQDEELSQEDIDLISSDIKELTAGEDNTATEDKVEPKVEDTNDEDKLGPEHDDKTEEEREAIRERRRQERQQKKQQAKQREEAYKREIASLKKQVAEVNEWRNKVEQRSHQSGIAQIDNAMRETDDTIELAKRSLKEATESQNGEAIADATELYYAARRRKEDLERIKQNAIQQTQRRPQVTLDPQVVTQAKKWMSNKDWYNPSGGDMDTTIVQQIDKQLNQEGWDPRTAEYWEELDERAKRYLPHRYNSKQPTTTETTTTPRKPPTGGTNNGSRSSTNSFTLSPERQRALKEAGMWDDPEKRKQMIRRYMEMDKQNRS